MMSLYRANSALIEMLTVSIRSCAKSRYNSKRLTAVKTPVTRNMATTTTDPKKYRLNHTMLRVKEPQRSIKYYELLGMKLINKLPNPDAKFDLYFLGYDSRKSIDQGKHCQYHWVGV